MVTVGRLLCSPAPVDKSEVKCTDVEDLQDQSDTENDVHERIQFVD